MVRSWLTFLFHNGGQSVEEVNKAFIVLAAHFEGSVDINVGDVVVAGEDTGNEAVKLVIGGDAVMLSVDEAGLVGDVIGQLHALFDANNVAVAFFRAGVDGVDKLFGFSCSLVSYVILII